ncbi:MAG: HD domain-containing protein [Planctomycetes bacterium]|nr:HD domain-containing protein [Planctomycetota bacterium]
MTEIPADIRERPIILVEDDRSSAAVLRKVLERSGFERIEVTGTAAEAMKHLVGTGRTGESRAALVILDISLPDRDGLEVLRDIVRLNVPVIVYTDREDKQVVRECFESGAEEVFVKPGDLEVLIIKVKQVLVKDNMQRTLLRTTRRNQKLFLNILQVMAKTLEAKDSYTRFHSENVAKYSRQIARRMGFSENEIELIQIAGILHDFGKIGVAERILNKPGRLSEEELQAVQKHPAIAGAILDPIEELGDVINWIKYHHENFDGSGYPDGLKGDEIPLGARILQVADAYDAITSRRPYSTARSQDEAISEMIKCCDTQFDRNVVSVFVEILEEEQRKRAERKEALARSKGQRPQ